MMQRGSQVKRLTLWAEGGVRCQSRQRTSIVRRLIITGWPPTTMLKRRSITMRATISRPLTTLTWPMLTTFMRPSTPNTRPGTTWTITVSKPAQPAGRHCGIQVVSTVTGISLWMGTVRNDGRSILKSEQVAGIVPVISTSLP